jgi:hypothetical protein
MSQTYHRGEIFGLSKLKNSRESYERKKEMNKEAK